MTRARTLALLALPFALTQCAQSSEMRGRIAGLEKIVDQAERNGAMRCAPRELAIARSQLEFANIEFDQGFVSKAQAHLAKAEPNARAAELLSPPERCGVHPPDADGDGYADASDKCPAKAENFNGYQDEDGYLDTDGCPEPDNDLDGLLDAADKCPNEPEDFDGYEDEDGCPDPDNDKDSVPDVQDQCPNEIGSTTQEPLGCPGNRLAVVTDCEVKITQQIHFETNKDKIRPESYPVLNAVADVLAKNPKITLEVQGHTDNKGAAAYNKDLSKRRAQSVLKYLTAQGVTNSRLTAQGYGMERPLVDNSTADNRALNRRVQFVRSESSKEGCPKTGSGSP